MHTDVRGELIAKDPPSGVRGKVTSTVPNMRVICIERAFAND